MEENLSKIIALTKKYSPGEYQIALFVSYGYWLSSNQMEADLYSLMTKKALNVGKNLTTLWGFLIMI